jgi:hypothetical protein
MSLGDWKARFFYGAHKEAAERQKEYKHIQHLLFEW